MNHISLEEAVRLEQAGRVQDDRNRYAFFVFAGAVGVAVLTLTGFALYFM